MRKTGLGLLFMVTAGVEGATGLGLLLFPAIAFTFLLRWSEPVIETLVVGRITGASLLAMSIGSGMARRDASTPTRRGVLTGILGYDAAATVLLAYAAAALKMTGILLWPAVALHAMLAVRCVACLRPERAAGGSGA